MAHSHQIAVFAVVILLLSIVAVPVQAWVVTTFYEDTACASPLVTSVFAPGCVTIDEDSYYITCSGNTIITASCEDSSCTNCPSLTSTLTGNCTDYAIISCSSSFPSFPSSALVVEEYDSPSCSGEPYQWTYTTVVEECATVPCVSVPEVDISEKSVCGSSVTSPSSGGQGKANCTVVPGSCSFYLNCVESTVPCASTDYAVAYGYFFCSKYLAHLSQLSPQGQQWVQGVLTCLQNALVPVVTASSTPSCATIRSKAFASHPACYTNNYAIINGSGSICYLPPSDWPVIISIVYTGLLSVQGAFQTVITGSSCLASYSIGGVWKIGNVVGETYISLKSKIATLAGTVAADIAILDATDDTYTWEGDRKRSVLDAPANITFTITGTNATTVQQAGSTFNTNFATQSYWPSASVQQCSVGNASACGSSNITIYGAEPSGQSSGANTLMVSFLGSVVVGVMTLMTYL